jgi:hypothetical protein
MRISISSECPDGWYSECCTNQASCWLGWPCRRLGVERVVTCGVQTPNCIRATVYDAVSLDYPQVGACDMQRGGVPEWLAVASKEAGRQATCWHWLRFAMHLT